MTDRESKSFYLAIVGQSLHINFFGSNNDNSHYQKKYLMPDTFDNNLNLIILTKFISEKVKDFEKHIGSFIEKVNLITDAKSDRFSFSLKKKYDSNQLRKADVVKLISDAKQLFLRNNKNYTILHLLVDKYIVDGREYLDFPENVNYKEFVIDISFITVNSSTVKTLVKVLKDCNIELDKVISHKYSERFAEKSDISPCIAGKKVIDGINPSEVTIYSLNTKKQGIFEKMFNFFD